MTVRRKTFGEQTSLFWTLLLVLKNKISSYPTSSAEELSFDREDGGGGVWRVPRSLWSRPHKRICQILSQAGESNYKEHYSPSAHLLNTSNLLSPKGLHLDFRLSPDRNAGFQKIQTCGDCFARERFRSGRFPWKEFVPLPFLPLSPSGNGRADVLVSFLYFGLSFRLPPQELRPPPGGRRGGGGERSHWEPLTWGMGGWREGGWNFVWGRLCAGLPRRLRAPRPWVLPPLPTDGQEIRSAPALPGKATWGENSFPSTPPAPKLVANFSAEKKTPHR